MLYRISTRLFPWQLLLAEDSTVRWNGRDIQEGDSNTCSRCDLFVLLRNFETSNLLQLTICLRWNLVVGYMGLRACSFCSSRTDARIDVMMNYARLNWYVLSRENHMAHKPTTSQNEPRLPVMITNEGFTLLSMICSTSLSANQKGFVRWWLEFVVQMQLSFWFLWVVKTQPQKSERAKFGRMMDRQLQGYEFNRWKQWKWKK